MAVRVADKQTDISHTHALIYTHTDTHTQDVVLAFPTYLGRLLAKKVWLIVIHQTLTIWGLHSLIRTRSKEEKFLTKKSGSG